MSLDPQALYLFALACLTVAAPRGDGMVAGLTVLGFGILALAVFTAARKYAP